MDYTICFCGGRLHERFLQFDYDWRCNRCGFTLTIHEVCSSSSKEHLYHLYTQFKNRRNDPMNQLPSHYRK